MGIFARRSLSVIAVAASIGIGVSCTVDSGDETPPPEEIAYTTMTCPAIDMRPTPVAIQCCFDDITNDTWFERGSDHSLIVRDGNALNWKCKGRNGEACSGSACYYGPCGFAHAVITPSRGAYPYIHTASGACANTWFPAPQPHVFGDVTGTCPYKSCKDGFPGTVGPDVGYWEY